MHQNMDELIGRFDESLHVLIQNLGPQLISRAQPDLTPGQVFMLYLIRKEDGCSVSKLAEKMEVAPSAITVMLDRLENHGFVSRTRDKQDRRVVNVGLTQAGNEKLNFVMNIRKKVILHCFSKMEETELESFILALEKLSLIAQKMELKEIIGMQDKER